VLALRTLAGDVVSDRAAQAGAEGDDEVSDKEDIIRMTREAGIGQTGPWFNCVDEELERFAALVAAREREACAKVCNEREAERTKAYTYFTPKHVFTIKG
jgi:hypothetical protein